MRCRSSVPATWPACGRGVRRSPSDAPGMVLAGAAYDGLGIPACIRQGRRAADEVTAA